MGKHLREQKNTKGASRFNPAKQTSSNYQIGNCYFSNDNAHANPPHYFYNVYTTNSQTNNPLNIYNPQNQ